MQEGYKVHLLAQSSDIIAEPWRVRGGVKSHDKKPPSVSPEDVRGRGHAWQGALGKSSIAVHGLYLAKKGLEVDFHQALNRQDVGAHGAAQPFPRNALIGTAVGPDPLEVFVVRVFRTEARGARNSRA